MSSRRQLSIHQSVPVLTFLQNLAKGATGGLPQMPPLSWVAPTINVEELEKHVDELKPSGLAEANRVPSAPPSRRWKCKK